MKISNILLWTSLLLLFIVAGSHCWRQDRRPKVFGDKIPLSTIIPKSRSVQRKISAYHNFFRASVRPKASNMLEMSWHPVAARAAQKWSDACQLLTHDNATDRWTKLFGACGQNIFVATHKVPWYFAIQSWYLEYFNFTYGSPRNDLGLVGHYTQMIWATSHKVGCGFSECKTSTGKTFFNYICNYCPTGNYIEVLGTPYEKGKPCGSCPNSCKEKSRLCTNSCSFADLWMNCYDLKKEWPDWLCSDKSKEGFHRKKQCRATCNCKNSILPNYAASSQSNNNTQSTVLPTFSDIADSNATESTSQIDDFRN